MKRILLMGSLLFTKSFIVFYVMITQISFGQDCKTQAANKPSASVRGEDDFYNGGGVYTTQKPGSANITKMNLNLGKAESWIKSRLTGFTGAKLYYSNEYSLTYENGGYSPEAFYKATGIKGFYNSRMRFFAYYCYDNSNAIQTEAESGSFVSVTFNNVFASDLCTNVGVFTINGKPAFEIFEKSRNEGRIDFYNVRSKSNANDSIYTSKQDYIIIRNSDKPVFIPITRKEYLEQMLKDIEAYSIKQKDFKTQFYKSQAKQLEEEIKIKKQYDKKYTPEKEAAERKYFNETNNPENSDKDLKKLEDEVKGARLIITEYLDKPKEWLSRGLRSFYSGSFETYHPPGVKQYLDNLDIFTESREDLTRKEIVSINPAYFNKTLTIDVPQLIMVRLEKKSYPHMLKVTRLIMQPGALAPLEAIINLGKTTTPEVVLPEITSTYSLKYLSKLTNLTTLTVPAGMKPSATPVVSDYNNNVPTAKFNFEIPALSPKLNQLQQLLTSESYKNYIQQLNTDISKAIKPDEKKNADDYLNNNKITQSKDISNAAFAAWLQNAPTASLYLYSTAVITNPSDALAANNFSAFLTMGGIPEKTIPILEYWNKQKPGEATILCNLGNAYYRLGDVDKAMKNLLQCLEYDTLNPTANKILCIMYLKKGDTKKAEEHGKKSITSSYDEQVVTILRELNNKTKPGEIMTRLPAKEFPMLKRFKLPAMPSSLDEMELFEIDLEAEKKSLQITIEDIETKMPKVNDDALQKSMVAGFSKGISPLQVKAQFIIMDAMQISPQDKFREYDVFKYHMKKVTAPYNAKVKAISKKYGDQLNKLEGGEAGDEDEITALELAKCKEINAEKQKYLAALAPLVNEYAARQEFINRKFYRDYANWAPYWMPETTISFPSIESDYLQAVYSILGEYRIVNKSNCAAFEPLPKKEGKLQKWEDEYCANFKGKIGLGPVKVTATCNSWGIEGGEGVVGEFEMSFNEDGSFNEFTIGGGLGATWGVGNEKTAKIGASASIKEFIKIGPDITTGKWGVNDFGAKVEASLEGNIGKVSTETKLVEASVAVNAGLNLGGAVPPKFNLK